MKKYLISGFNTVQDVKLEVGTYTLVAYVKSMHGDVYTFALGDGTDWEEFSIDVIQGQLCKVWLTFTIDKKATKFKPIANNFTEEFPVYVADLQLTRGNIPVESGASPFDIDQILNDLHDEIDAIEDFTEGAFKDGLLNDVEKTQLRASLDAVGAIVESVKGSYDKLKVNPFISQDRMADINRTYNDFMVAWVNIYFDPENPIVEDSEGNRINMGGLKDIILWIVYGDHIVDENERAEKDRALEAFNSALYAYNLAEKEVYKDIGDEIEDVQNEINSLEDFTNKAFEDGIIDRAEAKAIEKYINTVNESFESVKSTYDKMLLNSLLITAEKAKLTGKYTPLSTAKGNLITSITTAIADGVATKAEKADVDTKFGLYNTAMKAYQTALEEARIAMDVELKRLSDAKVDEAVIKATYWSIKASTPVIYKDSNSATASGVHTPVTVTGELRSGTTTTHGGFISIQPNGGAETTATVSPRTIAPTNAEGKTSYTVRLYEKADKVKLLDTMTIPVVFKGASGVNAINAILSNEADVLPASPEGVVSDYTGSGTIIRVFEGATELTYGTGNGQYQVSASGSGINVGTSSTVGNTRVYGKASNMTSDNATITFTISGKTSSGASFSLTKVQTFAKSRVGQKGEDGITISQNQQGHTYRADLNGAIIGSLADGMVELTITSGSTPITCPSGTSGGTPTANGTYRVTRTLVNGITTNQSVSGGKYRITPSTLTVDEASVKLEIKIMMGGVVTSYPLTLTYQKQFDGADGKSTEFIFKGSTSDTTAPTLPSTSQQDDWYGQGTSYVWNDDLIEPTKTLPYVWASQRKKVDGVWGAFMPPKVWLRYADGVTSSTIHYAKSSIGTTPPSSGWSTSLPSPTEGWYLWTRTTTTYKVATTTVSYSVAHWAKDGDGIVSTTIEYAKSSSGTTIPTSWSTSLPTPTKGWYLWTRTTTVYKLSPNTVAYTISYWANDGKDGIDGEPPKISSGYPKTQYAIGDSKTIYPISGWGVAIIDVTESKPYLWSRQEIKYDSGDTLYTGYLMLTNITPVSYMAGEWDMRVAYTRNDKSYPIVTYKKGTNNRPLYYYPKKEGVIEYVWFVKPNVNYSSTWYKQNDLVLYENDGSNGDPVCPLGIFRSRYNNNNKYLPSVSSWWENVTAKYAPNGVEGQKLWEFADGVELIITEALMANYAKLDSFVFHKGKMFSQEGTLRGVAGSVEYTDEDHEPNFEVDGRTGKVKMKGADIEGKITATEGEFNGIIKTKNPAFPKAIIEIDGESNSMSVKDAQGEVKVLISPTEIGDIDDYFSDSVASVYGEIGLSESGLSRRNVFTPTRTIYAVKGDVFQISYDSLSIFARVWNKKPDGTSWEPIRVDVSALLRINEESFTLGSVWASTSIGGTIKSDTVDIKEGSIIYTAKSSGNLQFRLQGAYLPSKPVSIGEDYSIYGDTRFESGNMLKIEKVVNRSQIGIDGMMIANSKTSYTYMGHPAFETRRGNKGIRITPDGYFKLNSAGQWVEWNI